MHKDKKANQVGKQNAVFEYLLKINCPLKAWLFENTHLTFRIVSKKRYAHIYCSEFYFIGLKPECVHC